MTDPTRYEQIPVPNMDQVETQYMDGAELPRGDLAELVRVCENFDFADLLVQLADGMRWDPSLSAAVIPVKYEWDRVFPADMHLDSGRLTMAVWSQALRELADVLPPWEDPR